MTGTGAVTVTVAVAGRAYGCRRATREGGGDTKQNQFFRKQSESPNRGREVEPDQQKEGEAEQSSGTIFLID